MNHTTVGVDGLTQLCPGRGRGPAAAEALPCPRMMAFGNMLPAEAQTAPLPCPSVKEHFLSEGEMV